MLISLEETMHVTNSIWEEAARSGNNFDNQGFVPLCIVDYPHEITKCAV